MDTRLSFDSLQTKRDFFKEAKIIIGYFIKKWQYRSMLECNLINIFLKSCSITPFKLSLIIRENFVTNTTKIHTLQLASTIFLVAILKLRATQTKDNLD